MIRIAFLIANEQYCNYVANSWQIAEDVKDRYKSEYREYRQKLPTQQ